MGLRRRGRWLPEEAVSLPVTACSCRASPIGNLLPQPSRVSRSCGRRQSLAPIMYVMSDSSEADPCHSPASARVAKRCRPQSYSGM